MKRKVLIILRLSFYRIRGRNSPSKNREEKPFLECGGEILLKKQGR
jgi:hypothetical protein